jgi:molecular chaperone HtpG
MTTTTAPESQPFQAEVAELLNLMVHSVYSETDIFLRELISNASDACDKLRYEAISAPELIADGAPPRIRIAPNKAANTLSVVDSGIGMDRQELIDNLGTIARSGTKSFLSRLTEAKDGTNLISQFGVGFMQRSWWPSASSSPAAAPVRIRFLSGRPRAAAGLKLRLPARRTPPV